MSCQVTAQEIIISIAESMKASLEPLVFSALAPGSYCVHLRQSDYERLQNIFALIVEEARAMLDKELAALNRKASGPGLARWLKAFRAGKDGSPKVYLKPVEGWNIYFSMDSDFPDGKAFYIEASMSATEKSSLGELAQTVPSDVDEATVAKARRALAEDTLETQATSAPARFSPNQLAATLPAPLPAEPSAEPHVEPRVVPADGVYAEISFTDERGPQLYHMKKSQIVIGRGGREYWVDLKLQTVSDVSHEHLRLRYNEASCQFFLKDLSTFGTTINGEIVTSSIETRDGIKRDKDLWVALPAEARLGLADALFLDFRAVKTTSQT